MIGNENKRRLESLGSVNVDPEDLEDKKEAEREA